MKRKKQPAKTRKKPKKTRKRKQKKQTAYFHDGEVVGEVEETTDCGEKVVLRTVMVLCPEPLLREIEVLSDFNYIDRSDFVSVASRQLLDYVESRDPQTVADVCGIKLPVQPAPSEDCLVSKEVYPYEEDEDLGTLWAAEDGEDE